ncbi:quinone oxidoreductase family protein [Rhodococcus sp. ACT016]|uniref:quinone oxidoreductase family protein n=1 Tax=Rhodococcus sp. ACT016 TaxID=3134808 RepID=UPI003D2B4861
MRALRFERFGGPEVLSVVEIADPEATPDRAVVEVEAASINPSDVKNVAGAMEGTTLPRVPGRDFAGRVVDGPEDWRGVDVWGTGGDVGFSIDGSHAERIQVPVASLSRKPENLSFEEASVVGVNFIVGWLGVVETANLSSGESIAVFGVRGGVGSAVAQIARARGARVFGVARTAPGEGSPAAQAIEAFVPLTEDPAEVSDELRRLTGGRGVDVVYDAVGGVTTPAALASLAPGGCLVVISAVGRRTVELDLIDFYRRELRLLGVNSLKLDLTASARRLSALAPYFERSQFRPVPVGHVYDLDHGPDAYSAVAEHFPGRIVICPGRR